MAIPGQKTFLQIQQEISEEVLDKSIASDSNPVTRPTLTRLKQMINDAYREICSQRAWWFLFREDTFSTVVGQLTPYAVDDNAEQVTFMSIEARQMKLTWMAYSDWRLLYPGGFTNMGNTIPTTYTPAPPDGTDSGLRYYLTPPADAIYTVKYGKKLRITDLSADADKPLIPSEWQDVLVLASLVKVYRFLGDGSRDRMIDRQQFLDKRLAEMWKHDQETEESSWRWRDANFESAYNSYLDINCALYVPYGNG